MEQNCHNCRNAHKRGPYDLARYGALHRPYECLMVIDRTEYKQPEDWCRLWKEKDDRGSKSE